MTSIPLRSPASPTDEGLEAKARLREQERTEVERAVAGDAEAFADLYDRHVVQIYRHIYYLVNDRLTTEDLTAETFMKAWQAVPRYKERGAPFVAWLLRIAHNIAVSHLRSKREHSELQDIHFDGKKDSNPEEALRHTEDESAVKFAITQLREEQRQVIILRFVEELDYPQVATIIGKSVPAVRVIQHRALGTLRKIMTAPA